MSNNKRGIDPAIIAAVIGVMGTLCVTIVSLYASRVLPPLSTQPSSQPQPTLDVPTWTASPTSTLTNTPAPTDTVPVGNPTSTPAPDTPTPENTFTPAPPAIGSDWANGCISVLWQPYPATVPTIADSGCLAQPLNLSEPVNLFFTEKESLKFLVTRSFDAPQVFGLFAPIPANGTVHIETYLRRIQDAEIWMGVFAQPDITAPGLVAAIPPGENMRNRQLVQKKMPEQAEIHRLETFAQDPTQNPPRYSIVFEIGNGEVRIQKLRDATFPVVSLGSAQPWLFVGYQVTQGNTRIDAEFLNLLVQGQ